MLWTRCSNSKTTPASSFPKRARQYPSGNRHRNAMSKLLISCGSSSVFAINHWISNGRRNNSKSPENWVIGPRLVASLIMVRSSGVFIGSRWIRRRGTRYRWLSLSVHSCMYRWGSFMNSSTGYFASTSLQRYPSASPQDLFSKTSSIVLWTVIRKRSRFFSRLLAPISRRPKCQQRSWMKYPRGWESMLPGWQAKGGGWHCLKRPRRRDPLGICPIWTESLSMGTGSGSSRFVQCPLCPTPERWTHCLEYSSFSSAYGLDGITIINLSLC